MQRAKPQKMAARGFPTATATATATTLNDLDYFNGGLTDKSFPSLQATCEFTGCRPYGADPKEISITFPAECWPLMRHPSAIKDRYFLKKSVDPV
jgi:hypothetical protein